MFTDPPEPMLDAELTHRRHPAIEQGIADLKAGPLAHLPSGSFAANSAWLVLAAIAFNLTARRRRPGLAVSRKATTAILRTQLIAVPARIVRSARRLRLHLPPATRPGAPPGPSCSPPPADHRARPDPSALA